MRPSPGGTLEVIVDSCSLGKDVLEGLVPFFDHVVTRKKRFADYRVVLPIQIGTEAKRRIFPEFLRAELLTDRTVNAASLSNPRFHMPHDGLPPGPLERFYRLHQDHTEIIETDISMAYKLHYGAAAARLMDKNSALQSEIVAQANALISRYAPVLGAHPPIHLEALTHFCASLDDAETAREHALPALRTLIEEQNQKLGIRRPEDIEAAVAKETLKDQAERARHYFRDVSTSERYLLQAMYTNSTLNGAIHADRQFKKFRFNLGEQEIMRYMDLNAHAHAKNDVMLIVSEDYRAREQMALSARRNDATVFAIGNYGWGQVLRELRLIPAKAPLIFNQPSITGRRSHAHLGTQRTAANPKIELQTARNFLSTLGVSANSMALG